MARAGHEWSELDDLAALGAYADGRDPGAAERLDGADVGLRLLRQVLEAAAAGDVLGPAVELLVDRRCMVEVGLRHRHLVVPYAVHVVRDADRDLLAAGQGVELGEDEVGDAVHASGVPGDDGVVPTTAAWSAGRRTELEALLSQPLTVRVQELRRERTLADTGRVRLDDRHHAVDPGRRDAGPRARAGGDRVRRRHERIRPV